MSRHAVTRSVPALPAVFLLALLLLTAGCTGPAATPPASSLFEEKISAIASAPRYAHASWGMIIVDPSTGRTLYEKNADQMFVPASTTKIFSSAALLEALGPDYRFRTPVYAIGTMDGSGVLDGDLILVASGDPDMGGRTLPEGTIEFTNIDHGDANALNGAILATTDPLAGLDDLAAQVKEAGISEVSDVVIDDRLFETMDPDKDFVISPIIVNDNVVDITITPGVPETAPSLAMRPETSAYRLVNSVTTGPAGAPMEIEITEEPKGSILVQGTIAADAGSVNQTYSVKIPAPFARTLFIEALERQGVSVRAPANGDNPSASLPAARDYSGANKVAELTSPPLIEDVKLTLKVSQNLHADTYIALLAVSANRTGFYDGMAEEGRILKSLGLDTSALSFGDGEGGVREDLVAPRPAAEFLTIMQGRPYADQYVAALPVLGVDGSLATACSPECPARGKVYAKTGTQGTFDPMNNRGILLTKALAGYVDTKSGKRVAFAVFVNNVPFESIEDMMSVGNDLGSVTDAIYTSY